MTGNGGTSLLHEILFMTPVMTGSTLGGRFWLASYLPLTPTQPSLREICQVKIQLNH